MSGNQEHTDHLRKLLRIHNRRLMILEEQLAGFSKPEAPVHKVIERDDELAEIARLEGELRKLEAEQAIANASDTAALKTPLLPPVHVFISSTMRDLQPEREAVARALESIDLKAVRGETVGSQSASPYEVSLTMDRECDIYLGIYGGRYGNIVPGEGRSITEIEYHTARKLKKPILIYRKMGIVVEPPQEEFLKFVGDITGGHTWREFSPDDVPGNLIAWIQEDVQRELKKHPEWANRRPARERILLASLGLSPGAVTGLYRALERAKKPVTRVISFSPSNRDVRGAAGICEKEFRRLGVPYKPKWMDAEDIASDADAQVFKGFFLGLLEEHIASGAEVLVGITGGRSVMGALMAIAVQTTAPERVELYHLDVDPDIERDGRLPDLWNFENTPRWTELLFPSEGKCRLVRVPYAHLAAPIL